jgi:hypothetical protein
LKNKTIDSLYSQTDLSINNVSRIGSKTIVNAIYYLTDGIKMELLSNDDIEANPYDWKNITPRQRYSTFYFKAFNDSLFVISSYDSLIKSDVVWFAKQQIPLGVEVEKENTDLFYFSDVYPNPSKDIIHCRIFWDMRMNIEPSNFELFDLYGNIVAFQNKFIINKINSYSGEIIINVSALSNGIYFIKFKLGSFSRIKPIMVIK